MKEIKPIPGLKCTKEFRFQLRNNLTSAESLLWEKLRGRKFHGLRFRRQHGIGIYIVDFYHALSMTVVELDGSIHEKTAVLENDIWRERFLKEHGYKVIRFRNEEIYTNIDMVLKKIHLFIEGKS